MIKKCPNCKQFSGLKEAIYGMPRFVPGESKYYLAGCTYAGQKFVCINSKWGIEGEEDSYTS